MSSVVQSDWTNTNQIYPARPDPTPSAVQDEDPHIMFAKVAKIGFMDKKFNWCLTLSRLNRGS